MKKKSKPRTRRPRRRTSYERAFEDAQERLNRALEERNDCVMKLEALGREIPYLENVVMALTPPPENLQPPPPRMPMSTQLGLEHMGLVPLPSISDPAPAPSNGDPLAKYMPRPSALRTTQPMPADPHTGMLRPQPPSGFAPGESPDPDEFLPD